VKFLKYFRNIRESRECDIVGSWTQHSICTVPPSTVAYCERTEIRYHCFRQLCRRRAVHAHTTFQVTTRIFRLILVSCNFCFVFICLLFYCRPRSICVVCLLYPRRLCRTAWVGSAWVKRSRAPVCLSVFVGTITQKRMISECSNMV